MQFNEDQKAELTSIYMVPLYAEHYETYLENKIIKFFSNILDDYKKSESNIVQKFVEKREK